MKNTCEFCLEKADLDYPYLLAVTNHWRIYLADQQNYPGRCFIPLNRHCARFPDLTADELAEFKTIALAIEDIWREKLNISCGNWACLMNGAYGKAIPDPHVHFHFIPRYKTPVTFGGMTFIDENYGDHYEIQDAWALNLQGRAEIIDLVKAPLQLRLKDVLKKSK